MKVTDFIGEATEYDKKEMLEERKPRSWLKSVSAFANGIGGTLIFGVSDDGMLVGLADSQTVSEKISEIIKTKMDPVPQVIMENHTEDGKDFITLKSCPVRKRRITMLQMETVLPMSVLVMRAYPQIQQL